jgi:phage baseplate assembly protein W
MIYSDLNSISPTIAPKLVGLQSIYQSLHNIFSTKLGERLFLPEFGFDLEDELFEIIDDLSSLSVFNKVVNTITRWESRVVIDTSNTQIVSFPDENKYDMTLVFTVRGQDEQRFEFRGSFRR